MKKKLKWIIVGLVVAAAGVAYYASKSAGVSADVISVTKGEMQQYLEETAQVVSKDEQTIYIEGTGKVIDINVDIGDTVKEGDELLSLDKADLELQLKDAEAAISASKAQLKGTELFNYANKIELAKVSVVQAENAYESAKRNYENVENLYKSNASSKEELQNAQDAYNAASTAFETAKLQLEDVKNGYKAQLERAIINRDTILRNIQKQEVKSTIDGVVIEKLVEKNSIAVSATPAFVIGDVNSLELEADILADDANKIKIGNEVEISGKSINDATLKGKVIKIAPVAEIVTSSLGVNQRRVPVTVKMEDDTNLLKPGYSVDVKIITNIKEDIIKVPDTSVFDYKDNSNVFIVENGIAMLRMVKRGIESGKFVEIQDGLKEGDIILVKPDNNIKEGIKIKPLE